MHDESRLMVHFSLTSGYTPSMNMTTSILNYRKTMMTPATNYGSVYETVCSLGPQYSELIQANGRTNRSLKYCGLTLALH